jgi:hypothetical protein
MGQKVNPISLRLEKTNKNYNSLWYGELAYGEFLKKEIISKNYIEKLLTQIGETPGEIGILLHPKKGKILSPYLWVEVSRRVRYNRFQLKHITERHLPFPSLLKMGSVKTLLIGGQLNKIGIVSPVFEDLNKFSIQQLEGSLAEDSHPLAHIYNVRVTSFDVRGASPLLHRSMLDRLNSSNVRPANPQLPPVMRHWAKLKKGARPYIERCNMKKEFESMGITIDLPFVQYSNLFWKGFLLRLSLLSLQGRGGLHLQCQGSEPLRTSIDVRPGAKIELPGVKLSICGKNLFAPENRVFADPLFLCHLGASFLEKWWGDSHPLAGPAKQIRDGRGGQRGGRLPFSAVPWGDERRAEPPFFSAGTSSEKRERVLSSNQTFSGSHWNKAEKEEPHGVLVLSHIESLCEKICGTPITIHMWRSFWDGGSATFLSKEIAYLLQKKVPFPKIRREISREISENHGRVWNSIEGIRISCSGRSGGRSKKAQRGKSETFYWGRNSSSLFLSQVGFAKSTALTPLGAVGVKVWICYKSETVFGKENLH